MPRRDDDSSSVASGASSVSNSSSSGSRRLLPRLFGPPSSPNTAMPRTPRMESFPNAPRVSSSWEGTSAVPKYGQSNRMLLRSPLPSPHASPQSQIRKQAVPSMPSFSHTEDEDPKQRKKREEANVRRLVHMAKQQQSLLTAWFAASSAGATPTDLLPPRASSARNSQRKASFGNPSSSSSDIGPTDLDRMEQRDKGARSTSRQCTNSDAPGLGSDSSQSRSGIKAFLTNLLFPPSQRRLSRSPSFHSQVTLKKSNVTKPVGDVESGIVVSDAMSSIGSNSNDTEDDSDLGLSNPSVGDRGSLLAPRRKRLILCVASCMVVLALVAITMSVILGQSDKSKAEDPTSSATPNDRLVDNDQASAVPSFSPTSASTIEDPITEAPTGIAPTGFPTTTRPTQSPSIMPSRVPTSTPSAVPSSIPSVRPSSVPSSMPSASPSKAPSNSPSVLPTASEAPSSAPSLSPTTDFSTTVLETIATLSGTQPAEQYGYSVSMSADGRIVAVGARQYGDSGLYRSGRVEVFTGTNSDGWQQVGQTLLGRNSNDQFGYAVSLNDDGTRLAVSEPGVDGPAGDRTGSVRAFELRGDQWQPLGQELVGEAIADLFGMSLAMSGDGQRLAVGTPYHDSNDLTLNGQVRVFEISQGGDVWTPVGQPLDGSKDVDWLGWDVDLSSDGRFLVAGAPRDTDHGGYVRCFAWLLDGWEPLPDIVNDASPVQLDDRFGMAVSLDRSQWNRVAVGSPWKDVSSTKRNTGLVASYEYNPQMQTWLPLGEPLVGQSANERMGWSLQLASNMLSVGLYGSNQVSIHQYVEKAGEWDTISNRAEGDALGDDFGISVASSSDGQVVAVGAMQSTTWTGFVRVLRHDGTSA